ncbi:3-deoxy-manno-octulosonate cytidylyltransferase [Candidatus Erwinia haradaeae]|uniref:3-deoxy-manno-octulosonate cytidylyltransferase n=1 Tax=Candidatus Erwinia haradaeae TaxID=1922217 RepID=A0A451DNT3_9GAMM|nr:3-deoxy-manno-octulosonate cytidylyltransferase [Candidatus Erwinia haradaeae]VFP88440.1 3-deoxy-manno-octulosonate cytidylyltransferase [Candidatus Erwinia haradaeae]
MNFITIIPARFSSERMPGKPLLKLHGQPMILHVVEKALKSGAQKVIVATDHSEIANVVRSANIDVLITKKNHQSGTERLSEVIEHYQFPNKTVIVNVQGDEPMIPPIFIQQVAQNLSCYNVNIATLATPIHSLQEAQNSNLVKVVRDIHGYALYFSRAMIPWSNADNSITKNNIYNSSLLRHIGIYSYYAGFIRRYVTWQSTFLEKQESLEQLRVLWYGEKIHVDIINTHLAKSIDTPEDLLQLNKIIT